MSPGSAPVHPLPWQASPSGDGRGRDHAVLEFARRGRNVAASTQNQALSALLFLYRNVLDQDLPWLDGVVRAKRAERLPVVLTRDEVRAVWDRYERHQQMLADNTNMRGAMAKGAVRRGESLVAGLLRCGHCGRRLQVISTGSARGPSARYQCGGPRLTHGLLRGCFSVGALRIDEAIEREVLRVVAPGAIEVALHAADQSDVESDATRRALELERRQARYEADRAQRQYEAVEPENRLVGETLERRWNAALARVAELDQRLATLAPTARPAPVDRAELLALADDFPAVWRSPAADIPLKKRIVRLLIEEMVATATVEPPQVTLVMHWKGGTHTPLVVRKNRPGGHRYCTDRAVIDVVPRPRALPPGWRDRPHPQPPRVPDRSAELLDRRAGREPALRPPDPRRRPCGFAEPPDHGGRGPGARRESDDDSSAHHGERAARHAAGALRALGDSAGGSGVRSPADRMPGL